MQGFPECCGEDWWGSPISHNFEKFPPHQNFVPPHECLPPLTQESPYANLSAPLPPPLEVKQIFTNI